MLPTGFGHLQEFRTTSLNHTTSSCEYLRVELSNEAWLDTLFRISTLNGPPVMATEYDEMGTQSATSRAG